MRRMCTACLKTKATDTHLEYVILSTKAMIKQTHLKVTFRFTLPILLTVLTITNFHTMSLCVATPISAISEHRRFGVKCCLQFQDKK